MTIEEDITEWARTRPGWQQDVLAKLANGHAFSDAEVETISSQILDGRKTSDSARPPLLTAPEADDKPVTLVELGDLQNVNALIPDQSLTFATAGLTVVYGNNGSGKSGYARLLKAMVRARHSSPVLPDVFSRVELQPAATLTYRVGSAEMAQGYPGATDPALKKMSFYDEHCGNEYLTKESTLAYRPSILSLLDGLISVCDRIRTTLNGLATENASRELNLGTSPTTPAGASWPA